MIDILSGLKAGDSSCEKAMPGLENVPGGIAITIVMAAALFLKSCAYLRIGFIRSRLTHFRT